MRGMRCAALTPNCHVSLDATPERACVASWVCAGTRSGAIPGRVARPRAVGQRMGISPRSAPGAEAFGVTRGLLGRMPRAGAASMTTSCRGRRRRASKRSRSRRVHARGLGWRKISLTVFGHRRRRWPSVDCCVPEWCASLRASSGRRCSGEHHGPGSCGRAPGP